MADATLEIHQTRRFAKRLVLMAKAGKNERIVIERARQIITDLQAHPLHEKAECKRTRHGELRLDDCRKYDLSCGFRLVALKRDCRLIFAYIGSHDDCQRWIENNRDYQELIESTPIPVAEPAEPTNHREEAQSESDADSYEEQLMSKIDDRLLREIFSGLWSKRESTSG